MAFLFGGFFVAKKFFQAEMNNTAMFMLLIAIVFSLSLLLWPAFVS
ncbi:hypothetical protein AmDm5_1366 [Acetobacter malorum]|nr:hypothetical protein AmDm5_1366 [Acetobacter malorum]